MNGKQTIEISTSTFIKIFLIILGLVFVYLIRDILLMIFLAVIIAAAVDTPINWLTKHKVRRGLAVAIVYVMCVAILAGILYLIVPPLASQVKDLALSLPGYFGGLEQQLQVLGGKIGVADLQSLLTNWGEKLSYAAGDIFVATINIFGGIFSALIIFVISIYLAAKENGIKNFFLSFTPSGRQQYVSSLVDRILSKLGAWMRGQIILMAAVGILVFIGLSILKIKFALTLALLAGLLEIVPIIGPILAAVPAIVFALTQSLGLAILVAVLYYVIQEIEKYLIVPQVMKRALGLGPISIMVAILIGVKLYGIIGAIVSIPLAAIISVVFYDFISRRKSRSQVEQKGNN